MIDFMKNIFDQKLIDDLLEFASESSRKRVNMDLRNDTTDLSQRMLNALMPGSIVPIHRHEDTSETVICLCGRLEEVFYESVNIERTEFKEIKRFELCPSEGKMGLQIPKGVWHTIIVKEPSVIFEAKDGAYKG